MKEYRTKEPLNYRPANHCHNCDFHVMELVGLPGHCSLYLDGGEEHKICDSWTVVPEWWQKEMDKANREG